MTLGKHYVYLYPFIIYLAGFSMCFQAHINLHVFVLITHFCTLKGSTVASKALVGSCIDCVILLSKYIKERMLYQTLSNWFGSSSGSVEFIKRERVNFCLNISGLAHINIHWFV